MKIGIFGGSFNPPHKMHEKIALYLTNNYLDKVIFVPTGNKYTYKNNLLDDQIRYEMVKIITDKFDKLEVSDYEQKDYLVYTSDTLKHFKKIYPNDEIYFICGLDNLSYIEKWHEGEYILNNYRILAIRRNTHNYEDILIKLDKYKHNIYLIDMDMFNISSTYIRNNLDKIPDEYLDNDVKKYILKNNLYR